MLMRTSCYQPQESMGRDYTTSCSRCGSPGYARHICDFHHLGSVRHVRFSLFIKSSDLTRSSPMLQVAAGSISVCGASIGPRQYADAKRRLRLWSKTEDAWTCLWQSARYLKQALHADWGIYSHWAAFLTTVSPVSHVCHSSCIEGHVQNVCVC